MVAVTVVMVLAAEVVTTDLQPLPEAACNEVIHWPPFQRALIIIIIIKKLKNKLTTG